MSIEEIRQNWELQRQSNRSVNINCGFLRRIGKTQFLRQLMIEWRRSNLSSHIVLLVPNSSLIRTYQDLCSYNDRQNIIDRVVVVNNFGPSELIRRSYVFADEVPDAERVCMHCGECTFIAGTYSNHDGDRQNLRAQNLRINRNGDAYEVGIDFMQGLTEWQSRLFTTQDPNQPIQVPVLFNHSEFEPVPLYSKPKENKKEVLDSKIKFKFIETV
jgi:hypothetical protein